MFSMAEEQKIMERREAMERALRILGRSRIDNHRAKIIVACSRAIRRIDEKLREGRTWKTE
jgi:hypothetical protein